MSTLILSLIYVTPIILIGASWRRIYKRQGQDKHRISAWLGSIFTVASAMSGLWGLVIIDQLAKRSRLDYGYERHCFDLALLGFIGSLIWFIRSRNLSSTLTLVASLWITIFWGLGLMTL
jgi:hypothetical protein